MAFTKGRNNRLMPTTRAAETPAYSAKPAPASIPTAAEHQSVAAVFSPRTFSPSLKMTPAQRNPIPETTCAATRVGLVSPGTNMENNTKLAAPSATRVFVRKPANLCRHCLSNPMTAPSPAAAARLRAALKRDIDMTAASFTLALGALKSHPATRKTQFGAARALINLHSCLGIKM